MAIDSTDPRRGMPSASGMERLILCPGSWQLAQKCEPLPETQAQKDGTRLHKAMEKHDLSLCESIEERKACIRANADEDALVRRVFGLQPAYVQSLREQRLWNAVQTYSGQADVLYLHGDKALVLDYKFGRSEVAEVQDNAQLMTLAALVAQNYPHVQEIHAAILQPFTERESWTPPTVLYTREDAERASGAVCSAVSVAMTAKNPPLRGGVKQCKFCPAAQACPHMSSSLALMAGATAQSAELMSPQVLADRLALWRIIKPFGEQLEAVSRAKLEAGVEIPGYELTEGKRVFKVTDAQKAYNAIATETAIEGYSFSECCTVSLSKLDALLREYWQTSYDEITAADCKRKLRELLEAAGAGEWTQQRGSIVEKRKEIQA